MTRMSFAFRSFFPPVRIGFKIWIYTIAVGLYGLIFYKLVDKSWIPFASSGAESTVFSGLVLGFLISFRNNTAYDRWWEARKLWGQLINEVRNLCIKVKDLHDVPAEDRHEVGMILSKFGNELKVHLRRGEPKPASKPGKAAEIDTPRILSHRPIMLAEDLYRIIGRWRREGQIDGMALMWLDTHAKALMDICGACERIRNTPLAPSYRALLRHGIAIYLALGPIYAVEDSGGLDFLPVFMLGSYFLLGLEFVAEDVEEPFGKGGDNLALDDYCVTIEKSVEQILGVSVDSGISHEKLLPHNPVIAR